MQGLVDLPALMNSRYGQPVGLAVPPWLSPPSGITVGFTSEGVAALRSVDSTVGVVSGCHPPVSCADDAVRVVGDSGLESFSGFAGAIAPVMPLGLPIPQFGDEAQAHVTHLYAVLGLAEMATHALRAIAMHADQRAESESRLASVFEQRATRAMDGAATMARVGVRTKFTGRGASVLGIVANGGETHAGVADGRSSAEA